MKTFTQLVAKQNTQLTKLISQTAQHKNYAHILNSLLDPNLAQHCNFAKLHKDTLVLVVDSAAWATRLRYAIPDILKILVTQPLFQEVKKIRYLVAPQLEDTTTKKPKTPLSPQNEKLWRELLQELNTH